MSEASRDELLFEALLQRRPDRFLDPMPGAAAAREAMALLALAAPPVGPSPALRERFLAARPRPRRPVRPVVVVLDMIQDHLRPGAPLEVERARLIVPALRKRLEAARAAAVPVVYVCDTHASDDPDFALWPAHAVEGTPGADPWPELAPGPADRVVRKRTYSAFTGSTLGPLLDELDADELVLTGCATEIGLLATATEALQRGFVVTVPPDAQAGGSELGERFALGVLATMPPYDPRYLRKRA